jgi:hypothetical protein
MKDFKILDAEYRDRVAQFQHSIGKDAYDAVLAVLAKNLTSTPTGRVIPTNGRTLEELAKLIKRITKVDVTPRMVSIIKIAHYGRTRYREAALREQASSPAPAVEPAPPVEEQAKEQAELPLPAMPEVPLLAIKSPSEAEALRMIGSGFISLGAGLKALAEAATFKGGVP